MLGKFSVAMGSVALAAAALTPVAAQAQRYHEREVYEREAMGDPRIQPIAAMLAAHVPLEVIWTEAN